MAKLQPKSEWAERANMASSSLMSAFTAALYDNCDRRMAVAAFPLPTAHAKRPCTIMSISPQEIAARVLEGVEAGDLVRVEARAVDFVTPGEASTRQRRPVARRRRRASQLAENLRSRLK